MSDLLYYLIFFSLQQYCEVSIMSILQIKKLSSQKLNHLPKEPKELVLGFRRQITCVWTPEPTASPSDVAPS